MVIYSGKLEAFHMSCQRHILRICWFHHVTNAEVTSQTGQEDLVSHMVHGGLWTCPSTTGGDARPNGNATGRQHASRMSSQQQPTMEASMWAIETHLGPSSGDRRVNLC